MRCSITNFGLAIVEVCMKAQSSTASNRVEKSVRTWMMSDLASVIPGTYLEDWRTVGSLRDVVESVYVSETSYPVSSVDLTNSSINIHVYTPNTSEPEELTSAGADEGQTINAATVCLMPSASVEGLWQSLYYGDDVKSRLLNYIYATIRFSRAGVDANVVSWNRVLLLHGPPGTGKTSLCRALAHKLSIRLGKEYPATQLIEINSHSLFSRWFSESGKLVQGLFNEVKELCDDEDNFVVVLIDEVESLTAARAGSVSSGEPIESIRVVNALLTQLDKLKHRKNVLVVTTSNLIDSIDPAFRDRADIIQYVGLPPQDGVYWILRDCLLELIEKKLIAPVPVQKLLDLPEYRLITKMTESRAKEASNSLYSLAARCKGMSGRTLRRLPVLAAAHHLTGADFDPPPPVEVFLEAMAMVVQEGLAHAGV
ncbi:thyroid receptor-interacting protein 13 [Dacryopinax primogenitus]|uniref:Thyroid receptor-interacting protein 13 n=1 Tax=Dacryopinax primogenitus (strain DJM 731) TaxID=1858805 RepID=M5G7M7_DACPD|nr:thyroid receptor-interacting protein 13 [Dacryopinax primogenitus]EJU06191.1 thyroid receptor-interacting protein 13 [Dacryopinax primogenitus]